MNSIKTIMTRGGLALLAVLVSATSLVSVTSAAQISGRSVVIGSSSASANTSYTFNFTVPTTTAVKSAEFVACTTASGTCTTPSGFSVTSSTLASQPTGLGAGTGWTVSTATAGSLRLSNSSNATAPSGSQSISFASVVNPSATNSTFFFRIATYSTATWTGALDNGTVATSTAGQITVTAAIDETLTFTLSSATVALGTLSTASTASGTSSMTASANASSGYAITVSGNTLTSNANTITAMPGAASSVNNRQFGLNLSANTTPTVGSAVSGGGTGVAAAGYNTANSFKFTSGDTVASATAATNTNTYNVSYIANIDGSAPAGNYSTVLTYVATANY